MSSEESGRCDATQEVTEELAGDAKPGPERPRQPVPHLL